MDERRIRARLEALTGKEVRVRVCQGGEPAYPVGTLIYREGSYFLKHDLGEIVRFDFKDVRYVEIACDIIDLYEGAGEYWPHVVGG